jgi:hypothetical protein
MYDITKATSTISGLTIQNTGSPFNSKTSNPGKMAKFLNTRKCGAELGDLIQNFDSDLTLISPYLHLPKDFKDLLTYRNGKGRKTTLLFRKLKLNPEEFNHLKDLRLVTLRYNEAVHAKSYFNDQRCIRVICLSPMYSSNH